jgi:hypothetical protein
MTTTFQKRQKEMKRLEKRKMKEERRAQRKIENRAEKEAAEQGVKELGVVETTNDSRPSEPQMGS